MAELIFWYHPRRFHRRLGRLKGEIGIPAELAARGVTAAHIPALVEVAVKDTCHQTNPRPCTASDFEALFRAAM